MKKLLPRSRCKDHSDCHSVNLVFPIETIVSAFEGNLTFHGTFIVRLMTAHHNNQATENITKKFAKTKMYGKSNWEYHSFILCIKTLWATARQALAPYCFSFTVNLMTVWTAREGPAALRTRPRRWVMQAGTSSG